MTANPVPDLTRFPLIWCEGCKAVRPYLFDVRPADKLNVTGGADFVCSHCTLIVATLHQDPGAEHVAENVAIPVGLPRAG